SPGSSGTGNATDSTEDDAAEIPRIFDGGELGCIDLTTQSNGRIGLFTVPTIELPKINGGYKGGQKDDLTGAPDTQHNAFPISAEGVGTFRYVYGRPTTGGSRSWDNESVTRFASGISSHADNIE